MSPGAQTSKNGRPALIAGSLVNSFPVAPEAAFPVPKRTGARLPIRIAISSPAFRAAGPGRCRFTVDEFADAVGSVMAAADDPADGVVAHQAAEFGVGNFTGIEKNQGVGVARINVQRAGLARVAATRACISASLGPSRCRNVFSASTESRQQSTISVPGSSRPSRSRPSKSSTRCAMAETRCNPTCAAEPLIVWIARNRR